MSALRMACAAIALATSACIFDLADVVQPSPGARYQIAIDVADGEIAEVLEDVPILVALDATRIDYALTDDQGVRFFDADGTTLLAHEIESWDENGRSLVWLRLSVLEPGGRRIYLRFGDPAALAASGSVWESSVGVYHMAGDLAAGVHDSSTRALDGTAPGVAPDPQGQLGQAAAFDGAQSHIDIGMVSDFDVPPGEARTVQLWFRRNTTSYAAMSIVRTRNTCCTGYGLLILPDEWANMRHDIGIGSCCTMNLTDYSLTPFSLPAAANDTDWHQATVVMDRSAGQSRIYFDGELRQSGMLPTTGDMAGDNVAFGVDEYGEAFMNGSIDEVRVDARAYSDSWVRVQYRSESDALLTFGPIEPL